jgi:sugar phosphate isomerase/epimerase
MRKYPFRLGTTSYIIPADILPNVQFLADQVQDVELVLFEVDDGPNNLPSPDVVAALAGLAAKHHLTYTVHLPLDLKLGTTGEAAEISLVKARKVIDCTLPLEPWAYVLHLDGRELRAPQGGEFPPADRPEVKAWQERSARTLEIVGGWARGPERLTVENLENYPPGFVVPVLDRVPVSRCVDVGHLWLDGHDPLPHLRQALPRTRVIHLHGVAERDHQSLIHVPTDKLRPVVRLLLQENYTGVLTLEVFNENDFHSSKIVFEQTAADLEKGLP